MELDNNKIQEYYERYSQRTKEGNLDEAAVSLRKILECMVEDIWFQNMKDALWPKECKNLASKISCLHRFKFISESTKNNYQKIRTIVNGGAHASGQIDKNELEKALSFTEKEILKYFNQYSSNETLELRQKLAVEQNRKLLLQEEAKTKLRKKQLRIIRNIVVGSIFFFIVSGFAFASIHKHRISQKIQKSIDNYVESPLNHYYLEIGHTDKPLAANWSNAKLYSSNENVIQTSSGGKVTAVGEGEAFIVVSSGSFDPLMQCYKYEVGQKEQDSITESTTESTAVNTTGNKKTRKKSKVKVPKEFEIGYESAKLRAKQYPHSIETINIGDTFLPSAAKIWGDPGGLKTYSTNKNVVTVNDKGKIKAVGKGTAYVIIAVDERIQEGNCYKVH